MKRKIYLWLKDLFFRVPLYSKMEDFILWLMASPIFKDTDDK